MTSNDQAVTTESTTSKVSVATRDRIRSFGGATHEATITEALDALESQQFWAQAEAAQAWRRSLRPSHRAKLEASEAEVDAAFDGLE